jgi:hypothetical protein
MPADFSASFLHISRRLVHLRHREIILEIPRGATPATRPRIQTLGVVIVALQTVVTDAGRPQDLLELLQIRPWYRRTIPG